MQIREIAAVMKQNAPQMAFLTGEEKNRALQAVRKALTEHAQEIFRANQEDLERAEADQVPVQVRSFLSYMGNLCIPIPMMLIGASLAKLTLRKVFLNRNSYLFCAFKLLVVPGIAILLFRNLPVAPELLQIFFLMFSMPIATIVGMLSEEYAGRGNDANQIIALTTVLSVVTIPLLV